MTTNLKYHTSGVTVSHNEASIAVLESVGVPDDLVQEARETGRVARGAFAIHDKVRVSNVVAVVLAVNILAVPARGEHHLNADTI